MIDPEQIKGIKEQLISQIEKTFPEDKQNAAIEKIESMNSKELEDFLIKNNMISNEDNNQPGVDSRGDGGGKTETTKSKCIFCSIIKGEIPSYKIDENKDSLAILEINPLTTGHSIVVPKTHVSLTKLKSSTLTFAKNLAKRLKTKLKAEEVKLETDSLMDHAIINVIPLYKDSPPKKRSASEQELKELKSLLEKPIKNITKKIKIKKLSKKEVREELWLPRRIP